MHFGWWHVPAQRGAQNRCVFFLAATSTRTTRLAIEQGKVISCTSTCYDFQLWDGRRVTKWSIHHICRIPPTRGSWYGSVSATFDIATSRTAWAGRYSIYRDETLIMSKTCTRHICNILLVRHFSELMTRVSWKWNCFFFCFLQHQILKQVTGIFLDQGRFQHPRGIRFISDK